MDDLFTTEDVLLFVFETTETSDDFENVNHELYLTQLNTDSLFEANIKNFGHPLFFRIPFWTNFFTRGVLWCITIIFNVLVIRYYSKGKGSTRLNILALSYVDVIFAVFSVFASLIQLLFVNSLGCKVIEVVHFSIEVVVFSNYLYPSLFLAVDRFIAVAFPHKVMDLSRKVQPIKWGLLVSNVLVVFTHLLLKFVAFPGSAGTVPYLLLRMARLLFFGIQLFGTFALYMMTAVLLFRSNKTLGQATHG